MFRSLLVLTAALGTLASGATDAKPARKAPRPAASKPKPVEQAVPATRSIPGILVPRGVVMRPMTAAEAEANAVWNLRAGLNVAALQCQFSPFLATVRSYNDLLRHHSVELAAAQATLQAHFRRYDGAKGLNSFDQFTTKTYNSYSTLDAQYAFCEAAALAGRGALAVAKGNLGRYALAQIGVLRSSLTPAPLSPTLLLIDAQPLPLPVFE